MCKMRETILIIDDEKVQAEALAKSLSKVFVNYIFESYSEEEAILNAIENKFYTLAIVDIRMDKFSFDGIKLVKTIFEVNPFSKVLIISAFKDEYFYALKDILLTGKVIDVLDKKPISEWLPELTEIITKYYDNISRNPSEINNALLQFYADAKNESDTYQKGVRFEHFVSLLFQSFGYNDVKKRVIDVALNEVDLVIRNEINDNFLNKFGKYILIECKNKPTEGVSKNDFIIFSSKLKKTNGLSELGIIATTGHIKKNTYVEAMGESKDLGKIIFLSNNEFIRLIESNSKKEEFKNIIDEQVKIVKV